MNKCIDCRCYENPYCLHPECVDVVDGNALYCRKARAVACGPEGKYFQARTPAETLGKTLAKAEKVAPNRNVGLDQTDEFDKAQWDYLGTFAAHHDDALLACIDSGQVSPKQVEEHRKAGDFDDMRQAAKDAAFGRRVAKWLRVPTRLEISSTAELSAFCNNVWSEYKQVYGE